MAHSKNDKDYYNTPTRTTTHPIRRSIEALIKILNSATNKPYTCKELYCVLVKRAKENRIYVSLAEKWLCELGPIEEINEKKVFIRYCSGATEEEARNAADTRCKKGDLSGLLRMLGFPTWKENTKAGTITFRDYLDFLGDDFYRGLAPGTVKEMKAALNKYILPVIGSVQLQNADEEWQKEATAKIKKSCASAAIAKGCYCTLEKLYRSIRQNKGPVSKTLEVLCASLKSTRTAPTALRIVAALAHLDDKERAKLFQALFAMECPRLLLIVSLIYCGLSLAQILAFSLLDVKRCLIHGEPVYTYIVKKYYLSNNHSVSVEDPRFSFSQMRRCVLSPLAAACLERYKAWLNTRYCLNPTYMLNHTPYRRENAEELSKELTDLLKSIGIKSRTFPVQGNDGQSEMKQSLVNEKLILQDAQWVLSEVCKADLVMFDETLGKAPRTTDESHYIDRFSDLYALTRYYQLARFSPFSAPFTQARPDGDSLQTPAGFVTNSTWELSNPTSTPQKAVVESAFQVQLIFRM